MIERIPYTSEATIEGGREGHARTPEQLFAAGYSACFQSSLLRLAAGRELDLTGSRVTGRVSIGPVREGGFDLAVALDLDAPGIGGAEATDLMTRAHEICPYSRATRGNIEVSLAVAGLSIEWAAA